MIKITCTGDFKNITKFLEKSKTLSINDILHKYGQTGVKALKSATPIDTGETASMWGYTVSTSKSGSSVTWTNDNVTDGIPIVILIQYGHGTKNGGYVSGVDFINPAIKNIIDKLADSIWEEVTKV